MTQSTKCVTILCGIDVCVHGEFYVMPLLSVLSFCIVCIICDYCCFVLNYVDSSWLVSKLVWPGIQVLKLYVSVHRLNGFDIIFPVD